jgi:hypothetical protein
VLPSDREHNSGMKRCLWRFNDLLEEKDHTAEEHATGLEDDECYCTRSNKKDTLPPHTLRRQSNCSSSLVTLAARYQCQPALSLISPKPVMIRKR